MKKWQRGFELDYLKSITAVFEEHDKGLVLGAFTGVSERQVAQWLSEGKLHGTGGAGGEYVAFFVARRLSRPQGFKDFRGEVVAQAAAGAASIERVACRRGSEVRLLEGIKTWLAGESETWLQGWIESPVDKRIAEALGMLHYGTKIRASSELLGIWGYAEAQPRPLPFEERYGLGRLDLEAEVGSLRLALEERPPDLAQHYSSYNKRGSWTALSLRGYSDDPASIEKPAEMSRKWKAEHPAELKAPLRDTPARALYPEAEPLIDLVPGDKERIRIMALGPGGGELTRHSDITDPDSGIADGRLARVHIPIVTNPEVRFTMWRLGGEIESCHMAPGSVWYLDTRKPHTAKNGGDSIRIHLVMDVVSSGALRRLLNERAPLRREEQEDG